MSGRDDADDDGDSLRKDATRPDWPVDLRGVTESVVTTQGPNDRWNVAALGLHAGDGDDPVTARTWGNTRTRRNFHREGGGVVQFTADPLDFVTAALSVREEPEPVLPSADAWVRVDAVSIDTGESGGTDWEDWALHPTEAEVRGRRVPTVNRGFNAVVEATVAASRLDVPAYDTATLRDRLAHLTDIVDRCGGPAEREAIDRLDELTGWRTPDDGRARDR